MPARKVPSLLMKRFLKNEINSSKRILDVGCGDGVMALYLSGNKIKSMLNTSEFRSIRNHNVNKNLVMVTAVKGRSVRNL